jgi:hypothetical protein
MTTIIDKILTNISKLDKYIINKNENDTHPPHFSLTDSETDTGCTIPIEIYRKMEFTDEEEWNNIYNNKRCSIEALNYIEIKKRGEGPVKKNYTSISNTNEGPYMDKLGVHVCVWRSNKSITNFICEQFPESENIQFPDYKEGIYCCICHKRKDCREFDWSKIKHTKREDTGPVKYNSIPVLYGPLEKIEKKAIPNWGKLMIKVKYMLYNDKIVYQMSPEESILVWPWQMTYYQKFKHNNKNYKDSHIFLNNNDSFKDNYGVIN